MQSGVEGHKRRLKIILEDQLRYKSIDEYK